MSIVVRGCPEMTSSIGGRGGISQIMTVDDRGEGGCLAYLVSPDDVISGQPLTR